MFTASVASGDWLRPLMVGVDADDELAAPVSNCSLVTGPAAVACGLLEQ